MVKGKQILLQQPIVSHELFLKINCIIKSLLIKSRKNRKHCFYLTNIYRTFTLEYTYKYFIKSFIYLFNHKRKLLLPFCFKVTESKNLPKITKFYKRHGKELSALIPQFILQTTSYVSLTI